jgi:hypothetical protein
MKRALVAVFAALVLVPTAHAGGPSLVVGVVEDAARASTLAQAQAEVNLARAAGFRALRLSQVWAPGETRPAAGDLEALRNAATAARLAAMDLYLTVMNFGSRTTPLTEKDRADFAAFAAELAKSVQPRYLIVGNEPNINRFWLPQFAPDGSNAAAVAYEALLAETYDAVKAASARVIVLGGALSPRGGDDPTSSRHTHSPTAFIRDLGAAYRATARPKSIMDGFVIHPYEDNSSVEPVKGIHPNTTTIAIADYDKLVRLLGEAFDGTGQRGSTLPIYYGEFGVESTVPAAKAAAYTGSEARTIRPVAPATQARFYRQAVELAFCHPNVRALLLFHTRDEQDFDRWQSGIYYVDGSPKAAVAAVRKAIDEAKRGIVARCPTLKLTPRAKVAYGPGPSVRLTCDIDCVYAVRAGRRTVRGRAVGGISRVVRLPLGTGRHRVAIALAAPVNPGPSRRLRGSLTVD